MNDKSKTFCILPWIHAATYTDGTILLCCIAKQQRGINLNNMTLKDAFNSDMFKNARLQMLEGQHVQNCLTCYNEEKVGIVSHRQVENKVWERKLGREYLESIIAKTKEDGSLDEDLITVDLRLGNTCNLQCIMCRPVDTSKWVKHASILATELKTDVKYDWEWKVNDYNRKNFDWYKDVEFLESFYDNASNIKHIIFGGGEPLYIKEHKEILKTLVERGFSKNIELRYHTNGTIWDDEVAEYWNHFRYVEVMISIDGYDKVNDYIRYPAQWKDIEENLRKYDETPSNIQPKILCTVQALNIYYLPEFCDWIFAQNYKKVGKPAHSGLFHPGILHYPNYLSPKVFPAEIKKKISEKILKYVEDHPDNAQIQEFKSLVELMNSEDLEFMFEQTLEYIGKLDELRNTSSKFFMELFYE